MKDSKLSILILINIISGYIMSACVTVSMVTAGFFNNSILDKIIQINLTKEMEILVFYIILGIIFFLMFNLLYIPIYIIKIFLMTKDNINKKYVDTKQSIYTRDLPKYNSSIAGEIIDFKTTFEEEYIAGVIELISKGYIIEDEDKLKVDKTKSTEGLLRNEKYILETCEKVNYKLYLVNNYNFYKELKKDMYDLGLYKERTILKELSNRLIYYLKKNTKYMFISIYILFIIFTFFLAIFFDNFFRNFILFTVLYVAILIYIRKNKLTKDGEIEKEKMGKLKLFLEEETTFKEKREVERALWGRYSAFAVAFGLNKEMKDAIYKKIMEKHIKY